MGSLKLASIISATAVLTFFATFTATKNFYSIKTASENICPTEAVPFAAGTNKFSRPSIKNSSGTDSKNEELEIDKNSLVTTLAQQSGTVEDLVKKREAQQQKINSFRQFVATEHKQSLIDEASFRYETEVVDYQWASSQEDKLLSEFTGSVLLESYAPTKMSCRSTTCQIIIPSQDDASADNAYRAVWQVLAGQNSESNNSITYFRDPEKGEVVMYISAQGSFIFK